MQFQNCLVIVELSILVVGFTTTSDLFLSTFYGFFYMNARLNVPEFPLDKHTNNLNKVQKYLSYWIIQAGIAFHYFDIERIPILNFFSVWANNLMLSKWNNSDFQLVFLIFLVFQKLARPVKKTWASRLRSKFFYFVRYFSWCCHISQRK